ncbi:hypothetical protein C8F01DRAFT_552011 [Mycena amicta]|nr:hypothetical protein C8F01DRAFT_552011 [Mycena amicta]
MAHDFPPRDAIGPMEGQARSSAVNMAFYGMQTAGLLGTLLMLLTATIWHKVARRHSSWFSFVVAWLISCTSYLLTMGVPADHQPNHALCVLQAALIYSVPPLTAGATVALVVNVYLNLRSVLTASNNYNGVEVKTALIVVPYIPAWAVFTLTLRLGLDEPGLILRRDDGAYCSIVSSIPSRVSSALVAGLMITCVGIEIVIILAMRRAWETLQRDDRGSITITVRVMAFTLVGMLFIILSLVLLALPNDHDTAFNIVIAIIPLSSVIIFGTQKDILTAWGSIFVFLLGRRTTTEHGTDTWETFTPIETGQNLPPAPLALPQARVSRIAR